MTRWRSPRPPPARPGGLRVLRLIVGTALVLAVGGLTAAVTFARAAMEPVEMTPRSAALELTRLTHELDDTRGRLAVTELKLERLTTVAQYSAAYRVPADLAGLIYDAALAEDIHPSLGFQLVKVESGFRTRARSAKAALGLTQLRLPTARGLDPAVTESGLLDPDTNLRLGFRHLKRLLRQFNQDLELALRAYNLGATGAVTALTDSANVGRGQAYARSVLQGMRKVRKGS